MRRSVIAAAMMAAWVVWIGSAGAQPAGPNQPAAPPADEPPPKPTDVTIAESARYGGHGENSIGLYKCVVRGELIRCNLLFTRYDAGSTDYAYDPKRAPWNSKLVDNFSIEHPQVNGYFVNGRGQRTQTINLGQNGYAWFTQEFSGGAPDITDARIILLGMNITLRGPVETAQ